MFLISKKVVGYHKVLWLLLKMPQRRVLWWLLPVHLQFLLLICKYCWIIVDVKNECTRWGDIKCSVKIDVSTPRQDRTTRCRSLSAYSLSLVSAIVWCKSINSLITTYQHFVQITWNPLKLIKNPLKSIRVIKVERHPGYGEILWDLQLVKMLLTSFKTQLRCCEFIWRFKKIIETIKIC